MAGKAATPCGYWQMQVKKRLPEIIGGLKPDICFASYSPADNLEIGLYIHEKWGIPLAADFRDGMLFEPIDKKLLQSRLMKDYFTALETKTASNSIIIISAIDILTDYFLRTYPIKNVFTIENGFDDEEVFSGTPLKLEEGHINVVFTGSLNLSRLGMFDAVPPFLEYMKRNRLKNIHIHFIGTYDKHELSVFEQYKDIVSVHEKQPRNVAVLTQREADVLLAVTGYTEKGNISGKLYEYLFAGKPIVNLGKGNAAAKILHETGFGKSFAADDGASIVAYINESVKNPPVFDRAKIQQYSRRQEVKLLADIIKNIQVDISE
jgi:hypothetical protein